MGDLSAIDIDVMTFQINEDMVPPEGFNFFVQPFVFSRKTEEKVSVQVYAHGNISSSCVLDTDEGCRIGG